MVQGMMAAAPLFLGVVGLVGGFNPTEAFCSTRTRVDPSSMGL
jgi:hypothetical protein